MYTILGKNNQLATGPPMLTKKQVDSFHQDGFLAVRQVLPADMLHRLQETADQLQEESRQATETNGVFDLEPDHSYENPRLRRISNPVAVRPAFWEVATCQPVLDCVAALIGENVKFHHSKLNMKTSKGGSKVGWHQDFAFFPHTNFDLVACGMPLDPSTAENGCLIVIPGSHKWPILDHRDEQREFVGSITEDIDPAKLERAQKLELDPGDISFHHSAIIHGSTQNDSADPRRLFICQYAACDAIALDHRPLTNEFSERVVRGDPATHARLAGSISLPLRGDVGEARSLFDRQKAKS
ncbi:MAG: phytanoyl-CoA dioxygenase family protein [Pirellulales bacterium]|nr:phytanoyl-CoA dioxygenase family protein [Pirellulales bacterium]